MERDTPVQISDTKPVRIARARVLVSLLEGGWIEDALLAVEDEGEREVLAGEFHAGTSPSDCSQRTLSEASFSARGLEGQDH